MKIRIGQTVLVVFEDPDTLRTRFSGAVLTARFPCDYGKNWQVYIMDITRRCVLSPAQAA